MTLGVESCTGTASQVLDYPSNASKSSQKSLLNSFMSNWYYEKTPTLKKRGIGEDQTLKGLIGGICFFC